MSDTISCINCSKSFEVYPPDNTHTKSSRTYQIGSRLQIHECPHCGASNALHWS